MWDWRTRTGVLLGVFAAVALLGLGRHGEAPPNGALLSDCDGALREIVVQYVPEADAIVKTAYAEFLRQLDRSVTVHVVCPDAAAFDRFRKAAGRVRCRLCPVYTGHAMTTWARDRWLALAAARQGKTVLLSPREEAGAQVWPARKGDASIGRDLARAPPRRVAARRSALAFDGGDFVADAETVFVTPAVLARNLGGAVSSAEELASWLRTVLQRRVTLLAEAPPHHAGMFMMATGERRVLVGDPSLVAPLLRGALPLANPDFSSETQARFDSVAAACRKAGYRVARIPVAPDRDGRTWLTWLNVILDQREGRRIVYMPTYRGVPALNRAAGEVWRRQGYEVRAVDCTDCYRHFGSLRCLVNVLSRS